MSLSRCALLLCTILAYATDAEGQPSTAFLDLAAVKAEVLARNPSLRARHLEAQALGTLAAQVSAWPDPMVSATYQPYPLYTARGRQRSQWRLEQAVPLPRTRRLTGEIASLRAESAELEVKAYAEDLVLEAKQAYFELYRAQEHLRHVEDFQRRLLAFEDAAAAQFEVGAGPQQAILKAQLEKNTLALRMLELAARRSSALSGLERMLDRSLPDSVTVQVALPPRLPAAAENLVELARQSRSESAALRAVRSREEKSIELARMAFLPDFGVHLAYFDIAADPGSGRDALAAGLSVRLPVHRPRRRARLQEAAIRQRQAEAQLDAFGSELRSGIHDLVRRFRLERDQLDQYDNLLIPQAESAMEAALAAYTTGRTDFLNLLDSQRLLFTLQMNREDTFVGCLTLAAALERTLGIESLESLLALL